ncbi:hypothetical protein MAQ5080_02244 [Marinomonas aquimarina]|uniref:DUF2927 domain-containing protein n=1 Tax=Marinomonas aquimarina TaxID=295068 RepID=A0A1A8TIQ0_9GAMM|nr:DUF2927 domain-containing protein [Marinomonas aquimarina]SBS32363.1 hypothetical protein MAQ5080_02244 [Marinomonas aquimarina]
MCHNRSIRQFVALVLGLFSLVGSSAYAQGYAHWQQQNFIHDSFLTIALQREYNQTQTPRLVRWESPIYIYVESEAGDASLQHQLLRIHTRHLSRITGVPINFTNHLKQANIVASFTQLHRVEEKVARYIGNPESIRVALDEAICLGNFGVNAQGEIQRGVIIIPVNYARQNARFLDCIIEEITQLLGLPNDSDDVYPSIFNDVSHDIYLSPLDYILLKILYSPRLKAGMTAQQVDQLLPTVINDLYYLGIIDDAVRQVQVGSLKRHIGD